MSTDDIVTVTVIERVPKPERISRTQSLPLNIHARDTCGDGSNEFRHINPLVVWKNLPALYFIDSSVPSSLVQGIVDSFDVWNHTMGAALYKRTTSQSNAKIVVSHEVIDSQGGTLAVASWSYSTSRMEITRATITFDARENWALLSNESCGSNGSTFDIMNVAVHEVGHISGLSHAPTDRLQTMYASTGPGQTLGRTLGSGDILGFSKAYEIVIPPPPPPPEPEPEPEPEPIVTKPKITTIGTTTYLNLAYENTSGQFVPITTLTGTQSLPFDGPHAKIITIDGKQYIYLYYYRAANLFTTLGRIPLQ